MLFPNKMLEVIFSRRKGVYLSQDLFSSPTQVPYQDFSSKQGEWMEQSPTNLWRDFLVFSSLNKSKLDRISCKSNGYWHPQQINSNIYRHHLSRVFHMICNSPPEVATNVDWKVSWLIPIEPEYHILSSAELLEISNIPQWCVSLLIAYCNHHYIASTKTC